MTVVFWIGRILTGLFFLLQAINHFAQINMMTEYARSKGVPAPKLAVFFTGILLAIGGLSLLLWQYLFWGMLALVVFFVPVTLMMHNFWTVEDQQARMMEMTQFLKNMALLGFVLILLAQAA